MPKFKIEIVETLAKIVEMDARDIQEAEDKVRDLYQDGEIILMADNFVEYDIRPFTN